jgi:hypothetical protein
VDPPSAEPQRNEVTMKTGLHRLQLTRLVELGARFRGWSKRASWPSRPGYQYLSGSAVLLAVVIAGLVFGVTNWPRSFGHANHAPEPVPAANTVPASDDVSPQSENMPPETAAVDGLKILSQHWRRGGLGSNALVTFTLRNGNHYAVKDIEISCAFSRRDGSHLTDRTRVIHDTVRMRGRKRFARLHVGFVNINADRAKCTLVAASRI